MKYLLVTIIILCALHIVRDIIQIKTGYKKYWIARVGHTWEKPEYEIPGIVVLMITIVVCLFLLFKNYS